MHFNIDCGGVWCCLVDRFLRSEGARQRVRAGLALLALATAFILAPGFPQASAAPFLAQFLEQVPVSRLVPGADQYGPVGEDIPVAPILKDGATVGYAYITSDFVGTTGYSGKPIHVMVAVAPDGKLIAAELVAHSEPIVLIGIPAKKIQALIDGYAGVDLVAEAAAGGSAHELNIISGATVTVMVIDDSIIRSGLAVARSLGLGGLKPLGKSAGPTLEIDPTVAADRDWASLTSDGAVRRLSIDVGQINAAYEAAGDARAIARPEPGEASDTFVDMQTALVSVPAIGKSILGEAEYENLVAWLNPGEHAILIAGRGRYSFKGSGYVRGGIFDRIQLIQGDRSVRFRDKDHRRLGALAASGVPSFTELDLFKIPAEVAFEPTEPWRLQLLVNRPVSALEKSFQTFDLAYSLPATYTRSLAVSPAATAVGQAAESKQKQALWERVWRANAVKIAGLLAMLGTLTVVFFAQKFLTANERVTFWFRIAYLSVTLVFLGWYANAQLSIVNLMALAHAVTNDFTWDAFLLDPLVFILWTSVAAALIFWGRGAYCGWLCPFGALQELTNRLAKLARIPQFTVPWALHERLWPIKYIIFLGLFGISLASIPLAERYAEVEPFKTAIILNFQRSWPFVAYAVGLLGIGLFVERFYCRYLCPLGAALAIPGRMRMFDWLKRYKECGNPCQTCSNECMVQAIHPQGEINPNECLYCLHCQVRYQDTKVCPVCIKTSQRRARLQAASEAMEAAIAQNPSRFSQNTEKKG